MFVEFHTSDVVLYGCTFHNFRLDQPVKRKNLAKVDFCVRISVNVHGINACKVRCLV